MELGRDEMVDLHLDEVDDNDNDMIGSGLKRKRRVPRVEGGG
jgi:hypothetical protein